MLFLLSILSSSICDRTIELNDMIRFDSISTSEKETICFKTPRQFSLLLFKHIKDYVVVGHKTDEKQKLAGFYFGTSSSDVIQLISTKPSSFSFLSTFFLSKCQDILVSTLENDQITFTNDGKLPACYFHTHKNSTYAISIDSEDDSILVGLKNGMKFTGKMNDFIRSSSESFLWLPSLPSENESDKPAPKAYITVNMPNKHESHHGFKISLQPDQFTPIIVERKNHHHDGKDGHHQNNNNNVGSNYSYEYPPKYNYNNVYQNGTIIFTSLLSVIITFVGVFLAGILFIRLFFCVCLQRRRQNEGRHLAPSASDIPPVEFHRQSPSSAQQVLPQSVQVIPAQNAQQFQTQQSYVFYPNLQQPQFSQQQPQFVQQQQFVQQPQQFVQQPQQFVQQPQQQHPLQQIVYI